MSIIKIQQIGSTIRRPKYQRILLRSLGLRGIGSQSIVPDTNGMRRTLSKMQHLLVVCDD